MTSYGMDAVDWLKVEVKFERQIWSENWKFMVSWNVAKLVGATSSYGFLVVGGMTITKSV